MDLSAETLKRESWFRGDLRFLTRPDAQRRIYDSIKNWKDLNPDSYGPYVVNAHRGLGKSFESILMSIEDCMANPGWHVRFCAPTYTQAETIFLPIFKKIMVQCPPELQPEKRLNTYTFRSPRWQTNQESVLYVVSLKDDAEQLRGPRSNRIHIDEGREVPNLEYVVNDVLMYHFTDQESPLMVIWSTLPKSLDHPYCRVFKEMAVRKGRYSKIGGHEDKDVNPRDGPALLESLNGDETHPTWRREWLCEEVEDESALIIPEFLKAKTEVVVESHARPEWFVPLVFADFGYHDFTAVLFGYVDFLGQILVIEDEIVDVGLSLGEIAARIRHKEANLFPEPRHRVKRIGDATSLELADLARSHGLSFTPADRMNVYPGEKYDPDSACALLRTVVATRKIRIHSRCKQLIYQLQHGIRDEKGKFLRTTTMGHCDAISALVYGNRQAPWRWNPIPERAAPFSMGSYIRRHRKIQGTTPVVMGTMRIPGIESWN